jgi:hypothetical protein
MMPVRLINELFGQLLTEFKEDEEYGYYNLSSKKYARIGYATNITSEIVTAWSPSDWSTIS